MRLITAICLLPFYTGAQSLIREELAKLPALSIDDVGVFSQVDFYPNGFIKSYVNLKDSNDVEYFEENGQRKEIGINIIGIRDDTLILDEIDTTINYFIEITEGGKRAESFSILFYEFNTFFYGNDGLPIRIKARVPSNDFSFFKNRLKELEGVDWWYFEIKDVLVIDYASRLIYYLPVRREYSFWEE